MRIATIDLGTVSSRLLLAQLEGGVVAKECKRSVITNLGEGVDASGKLSAQAIERVVETCRMFTDDIAAYGPRCVCTTLTSAARDAANGETLIRALRELGLEPQVISGDVEARLTFYGVAHDFSGQRIAVADSGGGSTELAVGSYLPDAPLLLERAHSFDIGCRRITERFLDGSPRALERASAWIEPQFARFWDALPSRPERLVAVGGTVTTLVAMVHELATYDSSFVHLHTLTCDEVARCIERMRACTVEQIAALPGVQPKRAGVLLGGAVVIHALMRAGAYEELTVSENSLMAGLAATLCEVESGQDPAVGWKPVCSR